MRLNKIMLPGNGKFHFWPVSLSNTICFSEVTDIIDGAGDGCSPWSLVITLNNSKRLMRFDCRN